MAVTCAASVMLFSGCGTAVSRGWRADAVQCLEHARSAGAETIAPEETGNIRETLLLADRFQGYELVEDADRLYQLSSQKCQLLYRSLARGSEKIPKGEPDSGPATGAVGSGGLTGQYAGLKEDEYTAVADDRGTQQKLSGSETTSQRTPRAAAGERTERNSPASSHYSKHRPTLQRVKPAETTIYLTFDDGPSQLTLPIASYLSSEGIQATFFVLGSNIKGREKAITQTIAMGHRVGNHTYSHNLKKLKESLDSEISEVKRTGELLERLGGDGKLVRIPYGFSTKPVLTQIAAEGGQVFEWDINSKDSTLRGVRNHLLIENTVLTQLNRRAKKNLVLLFHDGAGHDSTLAALKELIPRLKREGYRFGLLSRNEKIARETGKRTVLQ